MASMTGAPGAAGGAPSAINRVIIVDDEEPGRVMLRYSLSAHPDWQVAGEFSDVASARAFLEQQMVDVVFLDIQMPRENGISLARSLSELAQPPLIIFVTAYNQHAVEAFEVHALDYVLKPFNASRLRQALARAGEILNQRRGYAHALRSFVEADALAHSSQPQPFLKQVIVRSVGEMECVRLEQVHWISSASNYIELHLADRVVLHRMTLSQIEQCVDPRHFMRVHRTVIVRIDQMRRLNVIGDGAFNLTLFCGADVAVSERHVDNVRACFAA
jgi:two-component system LytT family response regulator